MGSTLIGTIKEFDDESDDWVEYMERVEHFFLANEITDINKKKSILLSSCGAKTYKLFSSLVTPQKPGEVEWTILTQAMKEHQNPKPSSIVERYKLNKRDRKNGESVPEYISELRKLSQ